MKTNKKILFSALILLSATLTGCYEKFDTPAIQKVYTDGDFDNIVPINTVKNIFYTSVGADAYTGRVVISEDYVIKGKVISSDAQGNVYKTLYLQDETGAIEVKLGKTGIYNEYKPGQIVYVKTQGLCLGAYRFMLSLGLEPSEDDIAKGYNNTNIDLDVLINQYVFKGETIGLTSSDTTVVTSASQLSDALLGRLVRIEGLTSYWGSDSGNQYPSFLESISSSTGTNDYTTYYYKDGGWISETGSAYTGSAKEGYPAAPTWAYNDGTNRYYGSALFKLGSQPLVVRSSGYSKFALKEVPANGSSADITSIYTKYCSSSGRYITYQLLLNRYEDIVEK